MNQGKWRYYKNGAEKEEEMKIHCKENNGASNALVFP